MALPDNLTSVSVSRLAAAARGLPFQRLPLAEHKFVTCIVVPMFGVVDDLRCDTLASGRRIALNLVAEEIQSVDIPPGWIHALQALTDGTVVV